MYIPMNVKTHNTLLGSMVRIDELIKKAKEYSINTLTITDTNMYGVMDFYMDCIKNDIKPIVGLEISINSNPIILYAMNESGYKNLIKISTIKTEKEITMEDLKQYSNDLICIISIDNKESYGLFSDIYEHLFCGYKNKEERDEWARSNTIYINDVLCLDKSDLEYLKYLDAIRRNILYDTIDTVYKDNYLMSPDEYKSKYSFDIENNNKIGELCNLKLTFDMDLLPLYEVPSGDAYSYLKELCKDGLKRVFGDKAPSLYIERLKYELEIINKMGFCNYFLVVWDYVRYAKENDILVGPGRGSAAGSLVSYLLDITTVDPLKYNLLFERFLNPERISMPDIDIDFEDTRRDEVIKYCMDKYGIKRVAQIITFGTLGAKQAIRDVARTLDTDQKMIDSLCSMIDSRISLIENYKNNKRLQGYINNTSELKQIYKIALKLEGLKRHTSIHAAGVVMSKYNLDEVIPLDKSHTDFYVTGYSMEHLEKIGLLKMDFLVLRNLSLIHDVLKDVSNLTFDTIPLNDEKALSIFTNVNTLGIFQFESRGMMNFLRKFKPKTFADVYDAIALFRPGPMANIDLYIRRKHGLEKIDYINPNLEKILVPTAGIIIYQEQIMEIAKVMAGYSLGEADVLRRAMSKKKEDVLKAEQDKFIKQSISRGYDEKTSKDVFLLILKFASYGFNKAHSVVYAMIAYKMAYLKVYYPHIFMKHLLSMVIGSESKTKEYIYDAKQFGISILKPSINRSDRGYKLEGKNIRYPLSNIRNVGNVTASLIIEERNKGKFVDIYDFVGRCYSRSLNKKTFESLILAGAFDEFEYNKRTLMENSLKLLDYGELAKDLAEYTLKPEIIIYEEYDKKTVMASELELFGFYLSEHPVTEYRIKEESIQLNMIEFNFNKRIKVVGLVDRVTITKSDKPMCFITLSDETSVVELVMFNNKYREYDFFKKGDIIAVNGLVERRFDKYQINVNDVAKIE